MNVGNYTNKLSEWIRYKKYSPESIKNYVSCLGKFLEYFKNKATKPVHRATLRRLLELRIIELTKDQCDYKLTTRGRNIWLGLF